MRALVVAAFDLTRQLRQRHDRDAEFLGQGLEAHGNLRNLLHPVVALSGAAQKLKVVDKDDVKPMRPFQPPAARRDLADRQGGRVVDIKRAAFQRLRGLDETAEFPFGHVAAPDLFRRHLGGFGQDPRRQLLGRHFQ